MSTTHSVGVSMWFKSHALESCELTFPLGPSTEMSFLRNLETLLSEVVGEGRCAAVRPPDGGAGDSRAIGGFLSRLDHDALTAEDSNTINTVQCIFKVCYTFTSRPQSHQRREF